MITAVSYRGAPTCRLDQPAGREPAWLMSCPRVGYVPPKPSLAAGQVAAPVSVHVIRAKRYCLRQTAGRASYGFGAAAATDLGPYLPCTGAPPARESRPGDVLHGTMIIFSWIARQAVTSPNSQYQFMVNTGRCGGQGGSTYGRVTAGEPLTRAVILRTCTGTASGAIDYDPDLGPGGGETAPDDPGRGGSVLVGRFTAAIR
jgi:hypothetical protein